jgi:hypothetical protein
MLPNQLATVSYPAEPLESCLQISPVDVCFLVRQA